MSIEYSLGIYKYKSRIGDNQLPKLPEQLKMSNIIMWCTSRTNYG